MPAHEVEKRITDKLQAFLKCDAELFNELSSARESPATIQPLVSSAKKLAAKWQSLPLSESKGLVASFVQRVVVYQNNIEIMLSKTGLREVLGDGDKCTSADRANAKASVETGEVICLTLDAKLKRSGGELHLVVPPNSPDHMSGGHPKAPLIKAVARARSWYERVIEGEACDLRSLARHAGITERYVGKVFGCAFLAPDIVEAILEGRQPRDLSFEKLCKSIPLSWAEQRNQFGFPPPR